MHTDLSDIYGDPRIFENPIEASIELSDLTNTFLPLLKKRSRLLMVFASLWTVAILILLTINSIMVVGVWSDPSAEMGDLEFLVSISMVIVLIPATALGITLLILAFQERRFLSYLEHTSRAMTALEDRPRRGARAKEGGKKAPVEEREDVPTGGALASILGSVMWVGDLVPMVRRMTTVGRAILGIILLGLAFMASVALLELMTDLIIVGHVILMLVVFAVFIGPSVVLFQWLTRDHDFYGYYSRRHQALAEVAAVGIPPVPKGGSYLERFDTFLRNNPVMEGLLDTVDGGVDKDVGRKGYGFDRYYHGTFLGSSMGILVKVFEGMPDTEDLDTLLEEAGAFGHGEEVFITRAVALVTAEVDDIDDEVYDHIIAQGRRTKPGECALQMVMEVEGLYSLVPYVAM